MRAVITNALDALVIAGWHASGLYAERGAFGSELP
jgi:hypothetical protein